MWLWERKFNPTNCAMTKKVTRSDPIKYIEGTDDTHRILLKLQRNKRHKVDQWFRNGETQTQMKRKEKDERKCVNDP